MSCSGAPEIDCCNLTSKHQQQQQRQQPAETVNLERKNERSNNDATLSYDPNNCQVRVGVRIRPLASTESSHGGKTVVFANDIQRTVSIGKKQERTFTYDMVFDSNVTQTHLYERVKGQLLGAFLDGYNATIMAYGQTGSGKTYTMGSDSQPNALPEDFNGELGKTVETAAAPYGVEKEQVQITDGLDWESCGLIPRFMNDIFAALEQMALTKNENGPASSFQLAASFIEVYGDDVYDLLDKTGSAGSDRKSLPIREDASGTVMVAGLNEIPIYTVRDALSILQRGALHRTTAATLMNQCSSRSHAVFTIWLQRTTATVRNATASNTESSALDVTTSCRLTFVDLAGSERMKKTGAEGERAREGIKINEGLLALGNVINALADEERLSKGTKPIHVPYRQTKLTRLLQDALGGNSQTLFLACVSPSDTNISETLSTLQYANRARNIKNAPTKNVDRAILELQRLNAWTSMLQFELVRHRFGGYKHQPSILPIRLDEEEELSERAADSFAIEDLMQRQDVQEYLRDIYQKAVELKPSASEGQFATNFIETTTSVSSSTTTIPGGPVRSRINASAPEAQLSTSDTILQGQLLSTLPSSFSSASADFESKAILEVDPSEDIAILDQLLELEQHEIEFDSAQKAEQKLLKDVEGELKQKEELLLQLRHSLEVYHDMKNRYEALLAEMQSLEAEKLSLSEQLERALQDPAKGCSVAIKKKLEQVEQTLIRTRNEAKKQQLLYRKAEQEAQKCRVLERKITELKQSKVALIRKQREAEAKHKEFTEQKTREIQFLKRKERKNEQQLSKLEVECRHHKINLERRKMYSDKLSLKLKETESHLLKLLTMRKKELQERTKCLQSTNRSGSRLSSTSFPYKSLRASDNMLPLRADQEGDEENLFAPLNEDTSSTVFLLKRLISDRVSVAHGRRIYEECLVEHSKLVKQLMEEVKLVNELRNTKHENESPSDEILEHEKNLEDLELRIELMSSNLDDIQSRLGGSDLTDIEGKEDALSSHSAEINLISSCAAPVVRTMLWEIVTAFSNSQLEIRILEESMQRKDAAIKGLEKETEMLQRQLKSVSKDYNELRDLQLKDYVEQDSSFCLRELESKLASLKGELEHTCQRADNQATLAKQLKVTLAERERELALAQESLALFEAAGKNLDENVEAKTLLSDVQSIWEELGVPLQSRDVARGKIKRCLEDTCNRILEDAAALRNDAHRRIKIFSSRVAFISSALGIDMFDRTDSGNTITLQPKLNDYKKKLRKYQHSDGTKSDLGLGTGQSENQTPLLQKLDEYENLLRQLQPRYKAAKERRDRLALDLKSILKSIASLEDVLSINLKKLLNDVSKDDTEEGIPCTDWQFTDDISSEERSNREKDLFFDGKTHLSTIAIADASKFNENNQLKADFANSLSDTFLDACEDDLKHLRLRKRDILIRNNEMCSKARLLVEEMHVSPKEILSIFMRLVKKRSQPLPDWWDSAVAASVCEALCQKETIVGVSELYTNHLQMISEFLQIMSVGRSSFANAVRIVIENAHNVLLSTLENDKDAKEAYTSFHEALFRLPKMSKDRIQACIDELHVLVNAAEAVTESEMQALTVVWEALNVSKSERDQFWARLEERSSSSKDLIDNTFDDIISEGSTNLEEWISMAAKDAMKASRLLNSKLLKLQLVHAEVEDKRDKQDLQGKIITLDSEIRMISAKLAEFEEMAGNTQRLVTKKINSSNFLKEERFRKNVQSKFASKLEVLGKLLQEWQKKEGSTFNTNLLSEDVRALVVNLDGFDAWVEQRTAFMHLKTVKPKTSARKGIVAEDVTITDDRSSAQFDLSQAQLQARSKIRNNSSHQEGLFRSGSSVASTSYVRGVSNISSLSSGSSLQKAMNSGRSEVGSSKEERIMRTAGYDTKRTTSGNIVTSPAKSRSKSTPAKTKAFNSNFHKAYVDNQATATPKRIVIGSSNNPFGHVLTQEST